MYVLTRGRNFLPSRTTPHRPTNCKLRQLDLLCYCKIDPKSSDAQPEILVLPTSSGSSSEASPNPTSSLLSLSTGIYRYRFSSESSTCARDLTNSDEETSLIRTSTGCRPATRRQIDEAINMLVGKRHWQIIKTNRIIGKDTKPSVHESYSSDYSGSRGLFISIECPWSGT